MIKHLLMTFTLFISMANHAGDVEIGTVEKYGMEIAAVYIQPVLMEPIMPGMQAADIHLEADIKASADNSHGFEKGAWIPYLTITYTINKKGSEWQSLGTFIPMLASDGPHYAQNIKLEGAGKYQLSYKIEAPTRAGFFRHTDKETGVPEWWKPIHLEWEFVFAGYGKKGGY